MGLLNRLETIITHKNLEPVTSQGVEVLKNGWFVAYITMGNHTVTTFPVSFVDSATAFKAAISKAIRIVEKI